MRTSSGRRRTAIIPHFAAEIQLLFDLRSGKYMEMHYTSATENAGSIPIYVGESAQIAHFQAYFSARNNDPSCSDEHLNTLG